MSLKRQRLLLPILLALLLLVCVGTLGSLLHWYRPQSTPQPFPSDESASADKLKGYRTNKTTHAHQASIEPSSKEKAELDSVLKRMDATSAHLQSFVADIATTKYSALLETFDPPENGKFFYRRADDRTALIRWEIVHPAERILTIYKDEALFYQPNIKSAQKYKLGKNKDKAEYLALGIGQSPTDLKKTFNIRYLGSENVRGTVCSILELKPKDPKAVAMFSSITVWIKDSTGVSTRMKLQEPFEDYLLVDFSNEQLNKQLADSIFIQNLPDKVDMLQVN